MTTPPLKDGAVHARRTDWSYPVPDNDVGEEGTLFGAASKLAEYSKRFGVPVPEFAMMPRVAALFTAVAVAEGLEAGFCSRYNATAPATCGDAIDVPDIEAIADGDEMPADVMDCPGANKSTHVPQFENDAFASIKLDAATVIALTALAGE